MKQRFLYILLCVVFACSCTKANKTESAEDQLSENKTSVELNGKLAVKGVNLVNEQGETTVLKGVSYGWHNWWPRFYNDSTVTLFANEWNCNIVRASMGVGPTDSYLDNPEFAKQCVTKVVDSAIKNGIYVIIDWHSHQVHTDEAVAFFKEMATKYKNYPNVIYEIFNEPEGDRYTWAEVKEYSETLIKAIREIDKENIILIGSPHWDQDIHIAADDPIVGYNNIMYTLHFYAATHGKGLRDNADYAISKGLPLFVSECAGMEATGNGPINYTEWKNWLDWMGKHSISWVAWSVSDKDETCSMLQKSASSTGPWTSADIKEWGNVIKTELTK